MSLHKNVSFHIEVHFFHGTLLRSYEWNNSRKGTNGNPSFFLSESFYKDELFRNLIKSIGRFVEDA